MTPESRIKDKSISQSAVNEKAGAVLGIALVVLGILLNKWTLEPILAADEHIWSLTYNAIIVVGQLLLILAGLGLFWRRHTIVLPHWFQRSAILGFSLMFAVGIYGSLRAIHIIDPNAEVRQAWVSMVASEEVIVELEKELRRLSTSAMNLQIPDHASLELFEELVYLRDINLAGANSPDGTPSGTSLDIDLYKWQPQQSGLTLPRTDLDVFRALFDEVRYLEHGRFYVIKGGFSDSDPDEFATTTGFQAKAVTRSGEQRWVKASLQLLWRRNEAADSKEIPWNIASMQTEKFEVMAAQQLLFAEVLDRVMDVDDVVKARRSIHEEAVLDWIIKREDFVNPNPFFSPEAFDRHPGVSVVDIDRDGFDDFYVMERHTQNMLFRNRGDGSFEESAAKYGLDIEDFTTSAVFADFDNDGDSDVILGRSLEPSLYLVNQNGRFVDRTNELVEGRFPHLVSSVSVVDYDLDGLLDVYFSTYAADILDESVDDVAEALAPYLASSDIEELERRMHPEVMQNQYLNYPGPPNTLLKNMGDGRFKIVEVPILKAFRNTYQSTWADFDGDGDADVYLANDFALNNLVRNDGNGRFVDITDEFGVADIGFGMGASWGDYNNDGKQDLYVSNMFSKAGLRITSQLSTLDSRFGKMARGNSLFQNDSLSFNKVSGLKEPSLTVEAAGWAWGGQFIDVDNDGYQDLHVLSGYYTAPQEVSTEVDT
jgi:hypothetical protein